MSYVKIPPRQEFNVSHQVYEWLRSLSVAIEKLDGDEEGSEESINILLGLFSEIDGKIRSLENELDAKEFVQYEFESLKRELESISSHIDTSDELNAKISELENKLNSIPDESDLSLYKALSGLRVKTQEVTGIMGVGTLTVNAVIEEVTGQVDTRVEVRTGSGSNSDISVTSELLDSTNVTLTRGNDAVSINYVLKITEYING